MIAYAYYDPSFRDDRWIIAAWQRSWAKRGWRTELLGPKDAQSHPGYEAMVKRAATLPTVNNATYERTCYVRWLAMAQAGTGLFLDYDVMNVALEPEDCPIPDTLVSLSLDGPTGNVVGTRKGFESIVHYLMTCRKWTVMEHGRPHTSDMVLLRHMKMPCVDLAKLWTPGHTTPLVHVSTMSAKGRRRQVIESL